MLRSRKRRPDADAAETDLARERARTSSVEALIAHLKLEIERLRRDLHGRRSERTARLIDQLELELEELEAKATEDELAAEAAPAAKEGGSPSFSHSFTLTDGHERRVTRCSIRRGFEPRTAFSQSARIFA